MSPRDPTADCGALGALRAHGQPAQHSPPLPRETHHSHWLSPSPKADPFREDPQSPPAVPPGARQAGCHEAGSRGTPRTSGGGGICSGPGPGPPHFLRGRCQFRHRGWAPGGVPLPPAAAPHRLPQRKSRFCTAGTVELAFCPVTRWRSSTTCMASGSLAAGDPSAGASGRVQGGPETPPPCPAVPAGARDQGPHSPLDAQPSRSPLKQAPASFTKSSTIRGRWAKPGARTSSYTEGCGAGAVPRVRGPCPHQGLPVGRGPQQGQSFLGLPQHQDTGPPERSKQVSSGPRVRHGARQGGAAVPPEEPPQTCPRTHEQSPTQQASRDSCCKPPAWRWGPSPDWANNCCPPRGPTPGAPAPLPRPSVHPCTHPGDAVALEHPGPVLTSGAAEGSHAVAHSADGFCKQGQRQLDAAATQAQATPPPPRPSHTKLGFVQSSDPLKLFRG